jgi:Pseudouridylate synthases, 23S RNA-specific
MRKPQTKIRPEEAGASLASWLASRFTYFPQARWIAMIEEGRVRIGGEKTEPGRVLVAGETVSFDPPPAEEPEVDERIEIRFEDESFLVVEKSGSLPCHPGGSYFMHTLWGILKKRYGEEAGGQLRVATRLDRETSGLVLVCKDAAAAAFAGSCLAEGRLRKEYLALAHGLFPDRAEAEGFLVADERSAVRKKREFLRSGGGESCSTSFECLSRARLERGDFSLLRALPRTGRTHQIRATLLGLGFPIVGDKLYGLDETIFLRFMNDQISEEDLRRLILPHQALHCAALSFEGPGGNVISVRSEPDWPSPYAELKFLCEGRRP